MKKLKLCNVHKLALSNEGEGRKPIHIPFGTWAYDDTIDQTLDREHAEKIAADLAGKIAAGEPGIPVYQGHPDVPEYASKYPDKGALGWIKRILVNEDGMDLEVEWDRDPGKGFGWFSPFWTGDDPGTGATGKRNVIVDGLTSVGLVNNPNIREFRLANEAGENLTRRGGGAEFKMPQHLIDLAKRFDDRTSLANVIDANGAGHGADGKFDGSGSGGGSGGGGGEKVITITGDEDWMGEMPKIEQTPENRARGEAAQMLRKTKAYRSASVADKDRMLDTETKRLLRKNLYTSLEKKVGSGMAVELFRTTGLSEIDVHGDPAKVERAAHRAAILSGLKYNHGTRSYS